ncbi:recombinase family protein [Aeromonas media]|uniref:recombinase family protein n=1 Tax=Aeromonas media TaxID=651 RepID=UPI0038D1EFDB
MNTNTKSHKQPVAYSYVRLSSRSQLKGDGARRQMEAAELYCKQHSLTLSTQTFHDLGVSAYKDGDRPSLSDLQDCITSGRIREGDFVILEKLDRLSRKGISDTQVMLINIIKHGVIVISLMDNLRLDRRSLDDLLTVIQVAVAADLAYKESFAKSQRIQANKDAAKEKAKQGIAVPRKLPFWLSMVDGKYQLNERLPVLNTILDMKRAGASFQKISQHLNLSGVKPVNSNGVWNPGTLRGVLRNPALYGAHQITTKIKDKYVPTDIVRDYYPAVINFAEYEHLNGKAVQRPAGQSQTNHISGLVFCGCCGKRMSHKSRYYKDKKFDYYYCRYAINGACEFKRNIRDLHVDVMKNIHHLSVVTEDKARSKRADDIAIEISQVEMKVVELTTQLSDISSPLITTSIITALMNLEEQKRALLAEQKTHVRIDVDEIKNLDSLADSPKEYNIQLKRVIRSITVSPLAEGRNASCLCKITRLDGHTITFDTTGIAVTDTEKFKNELLALTAGVEDHEFED